MKTPYESQEAPATTLFSRIVSSRTAWIAPVVLALVLIPVGYFNFVLFHTLAEFFAITVAVILSVVAWYTYRFTRNNYLMYLGTGYFWIGVLDLLHTLSFEGVGIIPGSGANLSTQYWVITRVLEATLLLSAPYFLFHRLKREMSLAFFGLGTAATVFIISRQWMPYTFVEGKGLTDFKIYTEYFVIAILAAAIAVTYKFRTLLEHRIFILIALSAVSTIAAELCFTL